MTIINLPMKKAIAAVLASTPFLLASQTFAQSVITIVPPKGQGYTELGPFIANMLTLAFGLAILIVLVMMIWGAFEWITSGGDKDAVGKARNRIVNALIGLAVLAVAFALARVAGQFLGFDITKIPIPTPQ